MKKSMLLFALSTTLLGGVYAGYEYLSRGRCNPRGECKACRNCSGCKHCFHNGGSCSVCRR